MAHNHLWTIHKYVNGTYGTQPSMDNPQVCQRDIWHIANMVNTTSMSTGHMVQNHYGQHHEYVNETYGT